MQGQDDDDSSLGWFEIALQVASDDTDAATGLLAARAGIDGCEIVEHDGGSRCELRLHVRAVDHAAARARARELHEMLGTLIASEATMAAMGVRALDERVWKEDWKRHFARTRVGRRLEILPPWDAEPAAGQPQAARSSDALRAGVLSIVINPGMAFGTGRHETTAGCLELLERLVRPGDHVLDFGCGSGILAIAAARLGAARVLAIDEDPDAVNAARENVVSNAVSDVVELVLSDRPPGSAAGRYRDRGFDIAVANILAEPLAELAPALTSCVNDDGALILSGIESQRRALVEVAYEELGWRVSRTTIERSGWVSLALAKQGNDGARGL